ncbi:MAG: DHHA1 domain-containing protein, partial [Cyanobacteriota bacterium]
ISQELVQQFVAANEERKHLTQQVIQEASQQVDSLDLTRERAIVLAGSGWSQGVVGIAAGRLVEQYGCPTVLIAKDETVGRGYGSGRSIPGVSLVEAIEAVRPLLLGGGGHPMAAGIQVELSRLPALQWALRQELAARVSPDQHTRALNIEIVIDLALLESQGRDAVAELDDLYQQLQLLQPFGHGNPLPIVALMNFRPSRSNPKASKNGQHLSFHLQGALGSRTLWFWREGEQLDSLGRLPALDIALHLEASDWGNQPWQGKILAVRPSGDWHVPVFTPKTLQVEDRRQSASLDLLSVSAASRYDGRIPPPAPELLLARWPWLPADLAALLQQVQPQKLILAASRHCWEQLPTQLTQLIQLWQAGQQDPQDLSEATGFPAEWLADLPSAESIAPLLMSRVQESQAFHRWLDEASPQDIRQLCQRLLRPDPPLVTVEPEQGSLSRSPSTGQNGQKI